MEIQIVVFLALAAVAIFINTAVLIGAYRSLSGLTSKVTETVSEFSRNSETRQWLESCQTASERAAAISETTKLKLTEFDDKLVRAHEKYRMALVTADMKLEQAADGISTAAKGMKNIIVKPAMGVSRVASSVTKFLDGNRSDE